MLYTLLLRFFGRSQSWRRLWVQGHRAENPLRLTAWVFGLCLAHAVAMAWFEHLGPLDAVWLTLTTITTVGYGDLTPTSTGGKLATMLLIYLGAIFILARAVNDWFEARADRADRKLRGLWDWTMRDHLLIIADFEVRSLRRTTEFFERLVNQIRASAAWRETPVQLLTMAFAESGIPAPLRDIGVTHYSGRSTSHTALDAVHPEGARAVMVLASHEADTVSDAITFDAIDRVRAHGFEGPLVAECVDDKNRARMCRAGATAVVRPIHGYPELLARALVAPGTETILANLFDVNGNECVRIPLDSPWQGAWTELSRRLLEAGIGTPLAYADPDETVHANPVRQTCITVQAVFVLVDHALEQPATQVNKALAEQAGPSSA